MENFCSNCGKKINENADVCLNCGKLISKTQKNVKKGTKDNSWKGFCTFIGITLLIIQIIAILFNTQNCRINSYEDTCNLAYVLGFNEDILYGIGKNILLILSIIFLYLEDKKINNTIRIIFLTIIIITILIICGY